MSDTPNASQQFEQFLRESTESLAAIIKIAKEWYAKQGITDISSPSSSGPSEWKAGEEPSVVPTTLSDEQIDALYKGMSDSIVKEAAIKMAMAFLAGLTLRL